MTHKPLLFLFFIAVSFGCPAQLLAQPTAVRLPQGGSKLESNQWSTEISIYVTKEQEVYFESERLLYFDEIGSSILAAMRKLPESWMEHYMKILIHADVDTRYALIDKIKTEIASVYNVRRFVYLRTASNNNSSIPNRLYFVGQFKNLYPIYTREEEEQIKIFNDTVSPFPSPPFYPTHELEYALLSGDKEAVAAMLPNFSCDFITLSGNGNFLHKNVAHNIFDVSAIKKILEPVDVLFIRFGENLLYGDYAIAVQTLQKAWKELGIDSEKNIIEITTAFQNLLIEREIPLPE